MEIGVVAELCWSDDPDYTTGYVAGKNIGYVRIKPIYKQSKDKAYYQNARIIPSKPKHLPTNPQSP